VAVGPSRSGAVGPSVLREARRDNKKYIIGYPTKNGGNFWILRDRQKGFFGTPKKVHFWKIHFQNLFQKSKI
jgi:hypothetical protein